MSLRHFHHGLRLGRCIAIATHGPKPVALLLSRDALVAQSLRFAATDRSKVEKTLGMLRNDLQKQVDEEKRLKLIPASQTVAPVKLTLKDKIVHELKHYYHGFRLLALETRLSSKYAWRLLRGATLNRRERQQLVRTVSDLFRLVPFSIFIIVPFMELALPIFIKLFPNMLPSTFQETSKEEEKIRKQLKVRVEMAKFLQETIEDMALERKAQGKTSIDSKALEFAQFIKKVRAEGGYVSNEEIFKFSKLFEDELTLDNLSMSQLRSLCRLMAINTIGSPEILRFQLNMKIRELKADDKQIAAEGGVDVLNTIDLQQACRARGMRALGVSEDRLKEQLKQWLELSLNDKVPPSFLLLSRTLYLSEDLPFTDRLKTLVQSLPDGIAEHTRQRLTELEGGKIDHKARLELIKQIEDAIAKEKQLEKEKKEKELRQKQLQEETEAAKKKAEAEAAARPATAAESTVHEIAQVAAQVSASISDVKADLTAVVMDQIKAKKVEKAEEIKVDPKDLSSIEQAIVGGPIHEAKNDIIGLKEKVIEHNEDLSEVNSIDGAFSETKVARRLRSKINNMIKDVDTLVTKLEDEKRNVTETIADPAEADSQKKKLEQQVKIQDLINSLEGLKEGDDDRKTRIEQLLKGLDDDKDGVIDGKLVLEVIGLLEKHNNVPISASQMASMVEMLKKEDQAEAAAKAIASAQFDEPIAPQAADLDDTTPEAKSSDAKTGSVSTPKVDPKLTVPLQSKKDTGSPRKTV